MFELLKSLILTFWSFVQMFVFCESSEIAGIQFLRINIYCQCDWYLYPTRVQRSLSLIILGTQQTTILHGFGNILFTRETFQKVSRLKGKTFQQIFYSTLKLNFQTNSYETTVIHLKLKEYYHLLFSGCQWRIFIFHDFESSY